MKYWRQWRRWPPPLPASAACERSSRRRRARLTRSAATSRSRGASGAAGTGRSGEVRSPQWSASLSVWICRSGLVGGRSPVLVSSVWGHVCVLTGRWVSIILERGFWVSRLFFASLGRSAAVSVHWMYPGRVAHAEVRPPRRASLNRRCCSYTTCNRRCLICVRLKVYARAAAACSALCAVFGG